MSPAMMGALAGALLGGIGFVLLQHVANRIELGSRAPQQRRAAGLLRSLAVVDVLLLTTAGYFLGPMLIEAG